MFSARNVRVPVLLALLPLLLAGASLEAQDPPPAQEWKIFQEFGFLNGSWAGPAESGGRVGGRVVSFTSSVGGAQLSYRATTFYPAKDALPESSTEEVAYIVYDGGKGKYVALVVFSTKVWGIYEADVRPDGIVFTAKEMANLEAGIRSRWTFTRRADGTIGELLEVAPAGKEFAPYVSAVLSRK
ncbi:MAG TPA: hypothetical protein PLP50_01080 [Thermoanaerobaculia bacterium]|nr:hypothetical protein [Thermoanaerobaculia bacterium]HQN06071.1 hypothetical protein [Thermoanaerobaculia bacterium]HQP85109.1 hypothetical protein [Thermoanaerobaculia bacterium]